MNQHKFYKAKPLFYIFVLLLTFSCKSGNSLNKTVINNSPNIENTKWAGVDSDGDFYEYNFLIGGQLEYKTNTARKDTVTFRDKEDIWSLNGSKVIIVIGNSSVRVGNIKNNEINGQAWNKDGSTWTWNVKQKLSQLK